MEGQRRILPGSARAPPSLPLHRHGYGILNPLKKKAVNLTAPDQPPQTQKSRHSLEITPIPTVEAFNNHVWGEEFHACTIDRAEFETTWDNQSYSGTFLK